VKFVVREREREYEFLLRRGLYIVGRHRACDVPLDSQKVSRRHMSCAVGEREVNIEDLGSRNGVYVGGVRVKSATLKDGDHIKLGDVTIVFDAGQGEALQAADEEAAPLKVQTGEGTVTLEEEEEEEEETPFDDSLLPQKLDRGRPQLLERDGKWYAVDPASGKEVEIVPAHAVGPARKALPRRRSTRLVVAALAAVVLVLFAAALYRSLKPGQEKRMPGALYGRLIDSALKALDANKMEDARMLAGRALSGLPDREPARIVTELVELWGPWQEDFFGNWLKVQGALRELRRYHASETCREFVKKYQEWIDSELACYEKFNRARDALEAGRYEEAHRLLSVEEIPATSVLRKEEADFFQTAQQRFLEHIRQEMSAAAARRDWAGAVQWARKLSQQFPEQRQAAEQQMKAFRQYQRQKEQVAEATQQLQSGRFTEAAQKLSTVPESSPHYQDAQRLLRTAKAGESCIEAISLYDRGNAEAAVALLAKDGSAPCSSLSEHIESALEVFQSATRAEEAKNLIEAEHLWQRLVDMLDAYFTREHPELPSAGIIGKQHLANNQYYAKSLSQLATIATRRKHRAEEMVAEGKQDYERGRFAEARNSFKDALLMDPENRIGSEALEQMRERGRKDYWRALNYVETDTEKALQLLRRASELLPPDDKYYTEVQEKKKQLEAKAAQ